MSFENLRVYKAAELLIMLVEQLLDSTPRISRSDADQLRRASASVAYNIAEAFGRFHYGEKIQFLYYARRSLFETKYWLNRSVSRSLVNKTQAEKYAAQLTEIARQLNAFVSSLKFQRRNEVKQKQSPGN